MVVVVVSGEATVAETRRVRGCLEGWESGKERELDRENERVFGFWEIWEENESEESDVVREAIEIAIFPVSNFH